MEEEHGELGDSSQPTSFLERYGIYPLSKIIELCLTQAKLNPFEGFDAKSLTEPLDGATTVVRLFGLQELLWEATPDTSLYAHVSNREGILGWSMSQDPRLRLDIREDGSGLLSYGDVSQGGIYQVGSILE
jgi:hypothetical protein